MTGRYKAYPEYKESGVEWLGVVPSHWDMTKTSRYYKVAMGQTILKEDLVDEGKWPVFSATENNHYFGRIDNPNVRLQRGDIVIPARGNSIGAVKLVNEPASTTQTTIYCKLLKQDGLFQSYIYYFLVGERRNLFRFTQTAIPQITTEEVGNNPLLLPSFEEQQKIANFLDHETAKIDTLITKQEKLIELLKEKRQAVISHAVTKGLNTDAPMKDSGVEWLGEVPEHWEVGRVKNLAKLISKGTTPSTIGGGFIDEGIRFLKGENIGKSLFVNLSPTFYISEEVDAQLSRSRLQENDVLVIIAGATTGKASILTKELLPANTNQAVSFIRPKKTIYSKLIALWLSTEYAQRIIWMGAVQAAQPNLSMEDLGNLPIVLPDEDEVIPLLNEIDRKIEQFDALTLKANSAIELMKERKTALISAAVTGKIDVRHFVLKQGQQQGVQG